MFKFHKKIQQSRKDLLEWRKKESTNSRTKIEGLKTEKEHMQSLGDQREWDKQHGLKNQLDVAYREEEDYWARKSRVTWLQKEDNNTSFFHAVTA